MQATPPPLTTQQCVQAFPSVADALPEVVRLLTDAAQHCKACPFYTLEVEARLGTWTGKRFRAGDDMPDSPLITGALQALQESSSLVGVNPWTQQVDWIYAVDQGKIRTTVKAAKDREVAVAPPCADSDPTKRRRTGEPKGVPEGYIAALPATVEHVVKKQLGKVDLKWEGSNVAVRVAANVEMRPEAAWIPTKVDKVEVIRLKQRAQFFLARSSEADVEGAKPAFQADITLVAEGSKYADVTRAVQTGNITTTELELELVDAAEQIARLDAPYVAASLLMKMAYLCGKEGGEALVPVHSPDHDRAAVSML